MDERDIPEMDSDARAHALSVYEQHEDGGSEEFPVLKAFQQYIDAEQEKARKRMITMSIYFAIALGVIVTIFVILLVSVSSRNQTLNDRLVDFAMREREAKADARAEKAEERARQAEEREKQAQDRAKQAQEAALAPKPQPQPPSDSDEVKRLKELLAAEKEKAAAEKEKARQAELEIYRRKHYPECYTTPRSTTPVRKSIRRKPVLDDLDAELEDFLNDETAVNYFDDGEEEQLEERPRVRTSAKRPKKAGKRIAPKMDPEEEQEEEVEAKAKVIEPKAKVEEPKIVEPKVLKKVEKKAEPKIEPKVEKKAEPKVEAKVEERKIVEPKVLKKVETKDKVEEPKVVEPKVEKKVETKAKVEEPKVVEPKVEKKVETVAETDSPSRASSDDKIQVKIGGQSSDWSIPNEWRKNLSPHLHLYTAKTPNHSSKS